MVILSIGVDLIQNLRNQAGLIQWNIFTQSTVVTLD
jgi:hypothetical protein